MTIEQNRTKYLLLHKMLSFSTSFQLILE